MHVFIVYQFIIIWWVKIYPFSFQKLSRLFLNWLVSSQYTIQKKKNQISFSLARPWPFGIGLQSIFSFPSAARRLARGTQTSSLRSHNNSPLRRTRLWCFELPGAVLHFRPRTWIHYCVFSRLTKYYGQFCDKNVVKIDHDFIGTVPSSTLPECDSRSHKIFGGAVFNFVCSDLKPKTTGNQRASPVRIWYSPCCLRRVQISQNRIFTVEQCLTLFADMI